MKRPEAPCLFCDERYVGCHIECTKYKEYQVKQQEYREYITNQKLDENRLEQIEIKRFRR